jgi:hypothetical protein
MLTYNFPAKPTVQPAVKLSHAARRDDDQEARESAYAAYNHLRRELGLPPSRVPHLPKGRGRLQK